MPTLKIRKVTLAIFLLHTEHEVDSVLYFYKQLKAKTDHQLNVHIPFSN